MLLIKAEDEQDCTREVVGRMTRDEAGDMLPTEPGAEQGHTDVSGDYLCKNSEWWDLPHGSGRWSCIGTEAHGPCGPPASPAWCSQPPVPASHPHQSNWHALRGKSRWVQSQLSGKEGWRPSAGLLRGQLGQALRPGHSHTQWRDRKRWTPTLLHYIFQVTQCFWVSVLSSEKREGWWESEMKLYVQNAQRSAGHTINPAPLLLPRMCKCSSA